MAAPDVKKPARCGPGCRTTQKLRLQFSLNCGSMEIMLKSRAIELFGGGITAIADAIGVTYQAVDKWPDGDISRGKRSSMPQPKTRPDSPVPSLQGPCDRSLKSE